MMSMIEYIRRHGDIREFEREISRLYKRESKVKRAWRALRELQVVVSPENEACIVGLRRAS